MSDLDDLIGECEARDICMRAGEDGCLVIDAPRDKLTADLREKLKAKKAELLTWLGKNTASLRAGRFDPGQIESPASRARARQSSAGRLCANHFPPIPTTIPPASILADPVILCPRCGQRRVLAELRRMTGGRCYECWQGGNRG